MHDIWDALLQKLLPATDEQSNTLIQSLLGLAAGGIGLKLLEWILGRDSGLRAELRADNKELRDDIHELRAEVERLEALLDDCRARLRGDASWPRPPGAPGERTRDFLDRTRRPP